MRRTPTDSERTTNSWNRSPSDVEATAQRGRLDFRRIDSANRWKQRMRLTHELQPSLQRLGRPERVAMPGAARLLVKASLKIALIDQGGDLRAVTEHICAKRLAICP